MYIYIYTPVNQSIYLYIYRERERAREASRRRNTDSHRPYTQHFGLPNFSAQRQRVRRKDAVREEGNLPLQPHRFPKGPRTQMVGFSGPNTSNSIVFGPSSPTIRVLGFLKVEGVGFTF